MLRLALTAPALFAVLLTGCSAGLELTADPAALAFPDTELGQFSAETVAVELTLGARAELAAWIEPDGLTAFRLEPGVISVLQPGESETLSVLFTPDLARPETALLVIELSNVQGADRIEVPLTGRGISSPVDGDRDGVSSAADCDDFDPTVYPGAPEICDGLDNDCDGAVPEDEEDADGDGLASCAGDCDDSDPSVYAGADELCDGLDNDCDGELETPDGDGDGVRICEGDCDDTDPTAYPGADELCDGLDNDCDGLVPDVELDGDADGVSACAGDCDDLDPSTYPLAPELCDGLDQDCDGSPAADELDDDLDGSRLCDGDCDDAEPTVFPGAPELCDGLDNDCDLAISLDELDGDGDGFRGCVDCVDFDPAIYPGAPELCDGADNDCDGLIPADEVDGDGDGFRGCAECDDLDSLAYPGAPELCDGLDNDCDGLVPTDELDADGDGLLACAECDDGDSTVYPGAPELCDELDNDCDGVVPPDELDDDGDGAIECTGDDCDDADPDAFVGNSEGCFDAVDNDCDGIINQGCDCPLWAEPLPPSTCTAVGTFACPHTTAQDAIDDAAGGGVCSTVWLKPGTYGETLTVADDLEILGVDGAASTVVDAVGSGRVLTLADEAEVLVQGVRLTGGLAGEGGGLYGDEVTLSLVDVVLDGNQCTAGGNGGALYCRDCELTVVGSTFSGNNCGNGGASANNNGGALYLNGGAVNVSTSQFLGNTAGDGGAVFLVTDGSNHVFARNTFMGNDADDSEESFGEMDGGGAMFVNGGRVVIANNLFLGNTSAYGGGSAVHVNDPDSSTIVANNVMVLNSSSDGTIYFEYRLFGNASLVFNNIVASNFGAGVFSESAYPSQLQYNDIWDNTGGSFDSSSVFQPSPPVNNISQDPLFTALSNDGDPTNDDYSLQPGSPCIDAGHPGGDWNDVDGTRNDMGLFGGLLGNWAGP